jgi:hypothetical protein
MLERIERLAHVSVARGCGFAAIAVVTFMVGLSGDMVSSLKAGGFLTLIICLALVLKAWHAGQRPYKQTELWLMLKPAERPQSDIAQQVIGTVLREVYLRFALHAALFAIIMLLCAALYALLLQPNL